MITRPSMKPRGEMTNQERAKGIEPSTSGLGSQCSTTELRPRHFKIAWNQYRPATAHRQLISSAWRDARPGVFKPSWLQTAPEFWQPGGQTGYSLTRIMTAVLLPDVL